MIKSFFSYIFSSAPSSAQALPPPLPETSKQQQLRFLIENSNLADIQKFVENHPDLNLLERDIENKTFLDFAFRSNRSRAEKNQLVKYLTIKAPNLANLRGGEGNFPLHAVLKGDAGSELRVTLTQILLRAKADPNYEDAQHKTPLFCLAFENLPFAETQALLDLLIKAGANPNQAHCNNILNYPFAHAVIFRKTNFIHAYLTPLLKPYSNSNGSFYTQAARYVSQRSRARLSRFEDLKFRALAQRVSLIQKDPLFAPDFVMVTLETASNLGDESFGLIKRSISLLYPENSSH